MMVPTEPTACFIVIQTNFAFAFFQSGLDGPAPSAHPNEFRAGAGRRRIAQIEFQFGQRPATAAQDRPDARTWQPGSYRRDTQESKVRDQWTFTPFLDQMARPRGLGQLGRKFAQFARSRRIRRDARLSPGSPQHTLPWWFNRRCLQPDAGVTRHFDQIPFAEVIDPVQERRNLA